MTGKTDTFDRLVLVALCAVIAGGIALRLYSIDGSILGHHFIRQVDTAAMARNFAEEGLNILYPRIDWRGGSPGYVESEFPLYTYLVSVFYRILGEYVEIARVLNLCFFSLSMIVLFDLGSRLFNSRTALLSVLIYAFNPLGATFDHSFQPDSLMMLASLCALNFYWRWCERGGVDQLRRECACSVDCAAS